MSANTITFSTIYFEELPPRIENPQSSQDAMPSAIEEGADDARSFLYLFEDNNFEQAAAILAMEEARQRARVQATAAALIEAEVQRQRTQALADRLRRLMDEDEELIDMLGRRLLAMNGHQVHDLWHSHRGHHHHHRHGLHEHSHGAYSRTIGSSPASNEVRHDLDERTAMLANTFASSFVHAAPVIVRGHVPYKPKPARDFAASSQLRTSGSSSSAERGRARAPTHTQIAIHPLTGIPMLFVEQEADADESDPSDDDAAANTYDNEGDEEADEWPIDDESDLDWLGHELLHRQGGANVWVLGAGNSTQPLAQGSTSSTATPSSSQSVSKEHSGRHPAKQPGGAPVHLPTAVEEVDSDHELADSLSSGSSRNQGASSLSSASQRVAAALARAALGSPGGEKRTSSTTGQPRRQRAATVMSESEEEELETVGKPVVEEDELQAGGDAGSLNDRPRKSVKVADLRKAR